MAKKLNNPFVLTGYFGPKYFCDRKEETQFLVKAAKSKSNVTLMGNRRLGKTGLIKHVFHQLNKDFICIYADILPTQDLNSFISKIVKSISGQLPESTSTGKRIWKWIKSLRPMISFDSLTGEPIVSLRESGSSEQKKTLTELIQLLESLDKPVLIALDEFQQINDYPEDWFEAWLRSEIQSLKNVNFIFSGSRTSILSEMFNKPARPFYHSTEFLSLEKIEHSSYKKFIISRFNEGKIAVDESDVAYILEWTRGHTYYVQNVCNRVYRIGSNQISRELINAHLNNILDEMEPVFFQYRGLLTTLQWNLLRYMAIEEEVIQPTGKVFLSKYGLGNSASVKRALEALEEKEMVLVSPDKKGGKCYVVYDLFLMRWLQRLNPHQF